MSTYTPVEFRKMIDDLDDVIRIAIVNGNIQSVFKRERAALVMYFYLKSRYLC
jgi:hypothetical protein